MLKKRFFKTKDEVEVTFEFAGEAVENVALCIETEAWQPIEMSKRKGEEVFFAKVRLPKDGQFQFRYLLDGEAWENDHAADAYWPNEFGGDNSVVFTSNN